MSHALRRHPRHARLLPFRLLPRAVPPRVLHGDGRGRARAVRVERRRRAPGDRRDQRARGAARPGDREVRPSAALPVGHAEVEHVGRDRPVRPRDPPVQPADPAARHARDHRVELRADLGPGQGLRLPGPHHPREAGPSRPDPLAQPAHRRFRQLSAAPVRGGPHAALGEPRQGARRRRHRHHRRAPGLHRPPLRAAGPVHGPRHPVHRLHRPRADRAAPARRARSG